MIVQLKQPYAPPSAKKHEHKHEHVKHDQFPVAKPAAAPMAQPVGAPMGLIPSAAVMARLSAAPPMAQRVGGYAFSPRTNPRRRGTTFLQKVISLAVWLTVFGLLGAGGYYGSQYVDWTGDDAIVAQGEIPNPPDDASATPTDTKKDEKTEKKDPPKEDKKKEDKGEKRPVEKVTPEKKKDPTSKRPVEMPKRPLEKPTRPGLVPPPKDYVRPPLRPPETNPQPNPNPTRPNPFRPVETQPGRPEPVQAFGTWPRRLFAITVSNYLYFNPVNYGPKSLDTHELVNRMSRALHIPPSQTFELSDGAPGTLAKPPLRDIVTKAMGDYLKSSRAQDRIILLFSGHAIEVDGEAFLVPLDGESTDKETLISMKWVYEQLKACKARQKVLILDVCRYDPTRGSERPDSGKMTEAFQKLLEEPPEGVQIWSACSADEQSFEENFAGSLFLSTMIISASGNAIDRRLDLPTQKPNDLIPIEEMAEKVNKWVTKDVDAYYKQKQTPKVYGAAAEEGAAYSASEPAPVPVNVDWKFGGNIFGVASPELVQGILSEINGIPPVKTAQEGVKPIRAETLPLFVKAAMSGYGPSESPLAPAVKTATDVLKKHSQSFQEEFPTKNVEQLKKDVQPIQKKLAETKLELEEAFAELEKVAEKREGEKSKRWQATYDYVRARLLERMAYVFEYQYMLSEIRTDALPELQANNIGWRLASGEKMQCKGADGKDAKKQKDEAVELLKKIATDHKGTPYEILAKRESQTNLGLSWQTIIAPGAANPPPPKK
jgi:hypothetical protein